MGEISAKKDGWWQKLWGEKTDSSGNIGLRNSKENKDKDSGKGKTEG